MTTTNNKKGGRPRLNPSQKLRYRVAVKLCAQDYDILRIKAAEASITCSELARMAITGCTIRQRLTPLQMDCIRKLSGMGNNLNQIARKANSEGYSNARGEYLFLADKVDKVITLLEDDSEDR